MEQLVDGSAGVMPHPGEQSLRAVPADIDIHQFSTGGLLGDVPEQEITEILLQMIGRYSFRAPRTASSSEEAPSDHCSSCRGLRPGALSETGIDLSNSGGDELAILLRNSRREPRRYQ